VDFRKIRFVAQRGRSRATCGPSQHSIGGVDERTRGERNTYSVREKNGALTLFSFAIQQQHCMSSAVQLLKTKLKEASRKRKIL